MILCIGTAIVDCIIKGFDPDSLRTGGTALRAESTRLMPGGEAVNQSVALSKLGKNARIVCLAGDDSAAQILRNELAMYDVDTHYIMHPDEAQTPVTVMFVDAAGDRRSITNHSHFLNFHPEIDMSYMDGAEAVSLGSLFRAPFNDPDVIRNVVSEAKRRDLPVYADTKLPNANKMTLDEIKESLPMIDCIFPNEREGAFYTGKDEPEEMADVFLSYGVKSVIVKLGEKGCLYKDLQETIRLPGIKVDAVDATGAGDNFAAGFITMRSERKSIADALAFANACGAVSTTAVGATKALKSRGQVWELLAKGRSGADNK